jgi:hypothetical protein
MDVQDDANAPAKEMADTGWKFRGSEALLVKLDQKLAPHPPLNSSEMGPTWQAESDEQPIRNPKDRRSRISSTSNNAIRRSVDVVILGPNDKKTPPEAQVSQGLFGLPGADSEAYRLLRPRWPLFTSWRKPVL